MDTVEKLNAYSDEIKRLRYDLARCQADLITERKEIELLQSEKEQMKQMLKRLEWSSNNLGVASCPVCGERNLSYDHEIDEPHFEGCELARLLEDTKD